MKLWCVFLCVVVGLTRNLYAQSTCADSCVPRNPSAPLGAPSPDRSLIFKDPSCPLRLSLKAPARGDEISFSSGTVERSFLGVTFMAPFNKISDHLVLAVALQSDSTFPAHSARGSKESLGALKTLEDDPRVGMRWSLIFRANPQNPADDKVALRATWRSAGASSGFSATEIRLSPSNFTLWCR